MDLKDSGLLIFGSALIALGIYLAKSGREFARVGVVSGNPHAFSGPETQVVAFLIIAVGSYFAVQAFRK